MAVHLKTLLEKTQLLQPREVEDKTCHICYEDYLQGSSREFPRKLPCGHVIGTECLLLWTSSQTHATSVNCPWCTHPIIHSADAQYLQTVISAYVEAKLEQVVQHIASGVARAAKAVDRALTESRSRLLALAIVLYLLGVSFDNFLAWFPFKFLYVCIRDAIRHRLEGHHHRGVIVMVLGFCVGTWFHETVGHRLFNLGTIPFNAAIVAAYRSHTRLVLGLTLTMFVTLSFWTHPAAVFMGVQAGVHFFCCLIYYYIHRMMM